MLAPPAILAALAALPLPWPFEREFMQLALAGGLVVGICAPLIGTFLVHRRMALLGDGLGHLAFAGVGAGLVLGVWPIWTALGAATVGALAVERLRSRRTASGDVALALFFYSGIAGGVVLAGKAGALGARLVEYLFGSIVTVSRGDVAVVAALGAVVVVALLVTRRALFAVLLDEEAARVAGLPVDVLNSLVAVLAAVTVVAAMRVVGVLLVAALMVLPVAAAQRVALSFTGTLLGGAVAGVISVVVGLVVARTWNLAPGGTVVLTAAALFVLAGLSPRRHRHRPTSHHAH